jgi:hypothetical protein
MEILQDNMNDNTRKEFEDSQVNKIINKNGFNKFLKDIRTDI